MASYGPNLVWRNLRLLHDVKRGLGKLLPQYRIQRHELMHIIIVCAKIEELPAQCLVKGRAFRGEYMRCAGEVDKGRIDAVHTGARHQSYEQFSHTGTGFLQYSRGIFATVSNQGDV